MLIVRVFAQMLIAAAVMVLGYDALRALETGTIDPIAMGEFGGLFAVQFGLAENVDLEALLAVADGWPQFGRAAWVFVIGAPAFFILGVVGATMALLFRSRG